MTNLTSAYFTEQKTRIKNDVLDLFTYNAIGEDNTAQTPADTQLGSEILRNIRDSSSTAVTDKVTVSGVIGLTQANDLTIQETGWFNAAEEDVDTCETITGWTDSTDMTISLNSTTYFEGSGAINLTKDGSTVTSASTSKSTTSVDFTSKSLSLVLYIKDQTTLDLLATSSAVTIRFGSDSSNYYEWNLDKSELIVGVNNITNLKNSNADSTTGTPSLTDMDYFYINLETSSSSNTWSDGDIIMDYIKIFNGTMYFRSPVNSIDKIDSVLLYLDSTLTIDISEV